MPGWNMCFVWVEVSFHKNRGWQGFLLTTWFHCVWRHGTAWDYNGLQTTAWNHTGSPGAAWDCMVCRTSQGIAGHHRGTTGDPNVRGLQGTTRDHRDCRGSHSSCTKLRESEWITGDHTQWYPKVRGSQGTARDHKASQEPAPEYKLVLHNMAGTLFDPTPHLGKKLVLQKLFAETLDIFCSLLICRTKQKPMSKVMNLPFWTFCTETLSSLNCTKP